MKNITLSADERKIERAREIARQRASTLNQMFRDWLDQLDAQEGDPVAWFREFSARRTLVDFGQRKFTREEMNER